MSDTDVKLAVQLEDRSDRLDVRYIENIDQFEAKEEGIELYADGDQAGFVPYSKLRAIAPADEFPGYVDPDEREGEG